MKKVLFFVSALAGLFFAASCQQETLEPEQMNKTVTFTVEAPGALATKGTTINEKATIADGTNVNEVHYEVYKNVEGVDHALLDADSEPMAKGVVEMANKKANVTLDLLQDQEYTVIFWAQVRDAGHYDTSDLRCIELASSAKANDETRAAFFKRFDFDTYQHRDYPQIDLRRPFAQLNLLTTMESLKPVSTGQTSGYEIDAKTSQVIVTGLAASFNTVTGVGNYVDYPYTFNMYDTPEEQGQATLEVNGKKYHYVSMNYMFVPVNAEDGSATVDIDYEIVTDKGSIQHEIANVPIRENYRTNVIGNLFTKESKFEIIVDANFDGQELVEVWDGREVSEPAQVDGKYVISTAAELAWLSAAVNGTLPPVAVNGVAQPTPAPQKFSGKTFMLLEDIDLANPAIELPDVTWTPIGANGKFEGTFDGNGKTIRNLVVSTEGKAAAGLFANAKYVKNLTVDGATVTGQYKTGVIVGDGLCSRIDNCHVINATVTVTPYNKDEANNVGGIVGYLSAENEAWVKNCSVVDSEISGYRKVGGIAGAANQAAVVTGNTVANSTITADQTPEYKEFYEAHLGKVVGYKHAKATVSDNTDTDNVELRHLVNSVEELANAAEGAYVTVANGEYNLTENITVNNKPIQIHEGEVVINGHDFSITSGSTGDYAFITKGDNASLVLDASVISLGGGVSAANNGKVVFNGQGVDISNYTNSSPARYNFYARTGGEIVINSGTFKFNSTNNTRRAYVCVEEGGKVIINGGTFGKASTRSDYKKGIRVLDAQSSVIITGGTFGFDPTEWVAAGYHAMKEGNNWVVVSLSEGDNLNDAVAVAGATVNMAAGEYVFPSSSIAEGVTLNCEEGTVFTGNSKLNINGATVIGATFSNPTGTAVDQTINGTFENCTFTGSNALRWCYAGETVVFKNCIFSGDVYGVHFDGGANDIIFENCTFSGFNAFAADADVTFDGCTFVGNGKSGYNGANLWGSAKFINTEFVFDGTTANEWIDAIGTDKTYEFTGCTLNGGSICNSNYIFSRNVGTKITIDGVLYTWAEGDYFASENGAIVSTATALQAAIAANQPSISLMSGTYAGHFDLTGKTTTIEAAQASSPVINGMVWADNCKVTLKGLTLTNTDGVQHPNPSSSQYYDTINSQYPLIGAYNNADILVVDCTMNLTGPTVYGFYGYAHNTPVFEGTTFNCNKIRPIANNGGSITVDGCTFVDQYHYSVRIFENSGERQTVVYTNNVVTGTNDKGEFEGINISKKGSTATVVADFTIKGNTDVKYRHHKNVTMSADCTYDTDMTAFAFEKEN